MNIFEAKTTLSNETVAELITKVNGGDQIDSKSYKRKYSTKSNGYDFPGRIGYVDDEALRQVILSDNDELSI